MKIMFEGREIDSEYFRAFVIGNDGIKRLANSWDEYQNLIKAQEPPPKQVIRPPKRKRKKVKNDNGS